MPGFTCARETAGGCDPVSAVESDFPVGAFLVPWTLQHGTWSWTLTSLATGFAQAVGAHRADLAPAPDLLLCLLTGSRIPRFTPRFPFVGLTCVRGPSPYTRTLE